MKPTIYGCKCQECDGRGYKDSASQINGILEPVKELCPECEGTGIIRYDGDRSGVEWERE